MTLYSYRKCACACGRVGGGLRACALSYVLAIARAFSRCEIEIFSSGFPKIEPLFHHYETLLHLVTKCYKTEDTQAGVIFGRLVVGAREFRALPLARRRHLCTRRRWLVSISTHHARAATMVGQAGRAAQGLGPLSATRVPILLQVCTKCLCRQLESATERFRFEDSVSMNMCATELGDGSRDWLNLSRTYWQRRMGRRWWSPYPIWQHCIDSSFVSTSQFHAKRDTSGCQEHGVTDLSVKILHRA
jgi:hypothetical protein